MKLLTKYLYFLFPFFILFTLYDVFDTYKKNCFMFEQEIQESALSHFSLLRNTILPTIRNTNELQQRVYLDNKFVKISLMNKSELLNSKELNKKKLKLLLTNNVYLGDKISIFNTNNYYKSYFIYKENKENDSIVVLVSQEITRLNNVLIKMIYDTLYRIVVFIVIFIFTAYWAGIRYIAKPIKTLINHLNEISQGVFLEYKDAPGTKTEITTLFNLVNEIAIKLNLYRENLLASKDEKIKLLEKFRHQDRLRSVGQMAAGMAHELGTPLNVISGRASLIISESKKFDFENMVGHSAQIIKDEATRMTSIIQGMLDFSRKKNSSKNSKLNLTYEIEKTIELLSFEAQKREVNLRSDLQSQEILLAINATDFQQVLLNLVKNAIQASVSGKEVVITQLEPEDFNNNFTEKIDPIKYDGFKVIDNGKGMSEKVLESIFDPFFTTKDIGEGTGLGLSVVYGIIDEYKGYIGVKSVENVGTTFYLALMKWKGDQDGK